MFIGEAVLHLRAQAFNELHSTSFEPNLKNRPWGKFAKITISGQDPKTPLSRTGFVTDSE